MRWHRLSIVRCVIRDWGQLRGVMSDGDTPDSVVDHHLSLAAGPGDSSRPGRYPDCGHRGDASERGSTNALRLPPGSPPHAPCSPSVGAVT